MPFKIGFWIDFNGFLKEKWKHVGTKIEQKSMPTSKSDFLKKHCFFFRKNYDFEGSGNFANFAGEESLVNKLREKHLS